MNTTQRLSTHTFTYTQICVASGFFGLVVLVPLYLHG